MAVEKKYEFIGAAIEQDNCILHIVRAVKDFSYIKADAVSLGYIKAGTIGCLVEDEKSSLHGEVIWLDDEYYDDLDLKINARIEASIDKLLALFVDDIIDYAVDNMRDQLMIILVGAIPL